MKYIDSRFNLKFMDIIYSAYSCFADKLNALMIIVVKRNFKDIILIHKYFIAMLIKPINVINKIIRKELKTLIS